MLWPALWRKRPPGVGVGLAVALQLKITSGPNAGQTIEVAGGEFTIGREAGVNLVLGGDSKVSRRHAAIKPLPDGRATLYDLGSSNGTYVNGHPIQSVVLSGNEQVQIGDTVFTAVAAGNGATAAPAAPIFQPPTPQPVARPSRTQSAIQRVMLQRAVNRATIVGIAA